MTAQFWQWWNWLWSDAGGAWAAVAVTAIAMYYGLRTLRELVKQNQIAHRSFVSSNRPRIRIRHIEVPFATVLHKLFVSKPSTSDALELLMSHEGPMEVRGTATVANGGNTDAFARELNYAIAIGPYLPATSIVPTPKHREGVIPVTRIAPGSRGTMHLTAIPLEPGQVNRIWSGRERLFLVGELTYLDDLDHERRTGFARVLNLETGAFDIVDDPNFEFED